MKKSLLALALAAATLAPFAVANATTSPLGTSASSPLYLSVGDIGTASSTGDITGPSYVTSLGASDYYFELNAPATSTTSYLGDLSFVGQNVTSTISSVSGSTLTAVPFSGPVDTTVSLQSGTEYMLQVTGAAQTPFVANISVSAAPEPAAWALMILGLGGIGVAMRRSRRNALNAVVAA